MPRKSIKTNKSKHSSTSKPKSKLIQIKLEKTNSFFDKVSVFFFMLLLYDLFCRFYDLVDERPLLAKHHLLAFSTISCFFIVNSYSFLPKVTYREQKNIDNLVELKTRYAGISEPVRASLLLYNTISYPTTLKWNTFFLLGLAFCKPSLPGKDILSRVTIYGLDFLLRSLDVSYFRPYNNQLIHNIKKMLKVHPKQFDLQGLSIDLMAHTGPYLLLKIHLTKLEIKGLPVNKKLFITSLQEFCNNIDAQFHQYDRNTVIILTKYERQFGLDVNSIFHDNSEPCLLLLNALTSALEDLLQNTKVVYTKRVALSFINKRSLNAENSVSGQVYTDEMPPALNRRMLNESDWPKYFPKKYDEEGIFAVDLQVPIDEKQRRLIAQGFSELKPTIPIEWRVAKVNGKDTYVLYVPVGISMSHWMNSARMRNLAIHQAELKLTLPPKVSPVVTVAQQIDQSRWSTLRGFVWKPAQRLTTWMTWWKKKEQRETQNAVDYKVSWSVSSDKVINFNPAQHEKKQAIIRPYRGLDPHFVKQNAYFMFLPENGLTSEEVQAFKEIVLNQQTKTSISFLGQYKGLNFIKARVKSDKQLLACQLPSKGKKGEILYCFFKVVKHADLSGSNREQTCSQLARQCIAHILKNYPFPEYQPSIKASNQSL